VTGNPEVMPPESTDKRASVHKQDNSRVGYTETISGQKQLFLVRVKSSSRKEFEETIETTGIASWFQEAFQNTQRLLLLFSATIFDDAVKFLYQDVRVSFLSLEVE
jgi:hypothetical protein